MKEPYRKGLANRPGPKSCAGAREGMGEALARVHAGQPLSSEITRSGAPTLYCDGQGNTTCGVIRESHVGPAESETLRMRENSVHENREIPRVPVVEGSAGRPVKVKPRTTGMHARGKSDMPIVPMKPPNKDGYIIRRRRGRREGA